MGRIYRINPMCPHCGEEHAYWDIQLTDEEQEQMDRYTEENKGKSSIYLLLGDPGIVVTRRLKCCCCGEEFDAHVGLWEYDEVGYHHPDYIGIGQETL